MFNSKKSAQLFSRCFFLMVLTVVVTGCTKDSSDGNSGGLDTNACGVVGLNTRFAENGFNEKIFQGSRCDLEGSPIVSLTILPESGGVVQCTGTMLTSTDVLTAAHCFPTDERFRTTVRAGTQDIQVVSSRIHPQYNDSSGPPFQNDIAVLKLAFAAPARALPLVVSDPVEVDDKVAVFGFGTTDGQVDSGVLRSGETRVVGINSQFLTTSFEDDGVQVCEGDSGGPAVMRFTNQQGQRESGIVGVISFVESPCDSDGNAGLTFTQGSEALDFLIEAVPGIALR